MATHMTTLDNTEHKCVHVFLSHVLKNSRHWRSSNVFRSLRQAAPTRSEILAPTRTHSWTTKTLANSTFSSVAVSMPGSQRKGSSQNWSWNIIAVQHATKYNTAAGCRQSSQRRDWMDSKIVWIELLGVQRGPCQVPNILRHTCGPLFRSSYELNKTHLQAFVRQSLRQARWSLAVSETAWHQNHQIRGQMFIGWRWWRSKTKQHRMMRWCNGRNGRTLPSA